MDNFSTGTAQKSRVQDGLRHLLLVTRSLENAGIKLIEAEANVTRGSSILFLSGYRSAFREWADANRREVKVEPHSDSDFGLNWKIGTEIYGVKVYSFLTDKEKEAYDAEAET